MAIWEEKKNEEKQIFKNMIIRIRQIFKNMILTWVTGLNWGNGECPK
jgi:hypothetical protein